MKRLALPVCALLLLWLGCTFSKDGNIPEGRYEGKTEEGDSINVTLVQKDDATKVSRLGYKFVASLGVDQALLKSQEPFGSPSKGKLIFQFPVFIRFSPSTNLMTESGGISSISYYQAEISLTKTPDELECKLTKIDKVAEEYDGKFEMRGISLASPPDDKSMRQTYSIKIMKVDTKKE
jgi:hypothetical protein